MNICVIGAGAAGLVAIKRAIDWGADRVVCYEQTDEVGGQWRYQPDQQHPYPFHSSMYQNVITILPKEVMCFPEHDFNQYTDESFVHHSVLFKYLKGFCDTFSLRNHIKVTMTITVTVVHRTSVKTTTRTQFGHQVVSVEPTANTSEKYWRVQALSLITAQKETDYFDAVLVCNGFALIITDGEAYGNRFRHYWSPLKPEISGLDTFTGHAMHSHFYRTPDRYTEKKVLIVGTGLSAVDIALAVLKVAAKVYLSYNHSPISFLPSAIEQVPLVSRIYGDKIETAANGRPFSVDEIVFAIGYQFSAPFLSVQLPFSVDTRRVSPLYQHLVHIDHPTLFLVGLNYKGATLPMFDGQVQFALAVLDGRVKLPCRDEMLKWEAAAIEKQTAEGNHPHYFGPRMWEYLRGLARAGGYPISFPPYMADMYDDVDRERAKNPLTYKQLRYQVVDESHFRKILPTTGSNFG